MDGEIDWQNLPDLILIRIMKYLSIANRVSASSVCCRWNSIFYSSLLWKKVYFLFQRNAGTRRPNLGEFLFVVREFGHLFEEVFFRIDSRHLESRKDAISVIRQLSTSPTASAIVNFKIEEINRSAFVDAHSSKEDIRKLNMRSALVRFILHYPGIESNLKCLDLSESAIAGEDLLVMVLSQHVNLEELRLSQIDNCSSWAIQRLLEQCRKLKRLSLLLKSISEDVLDAMMGLDRCPVEELHLFVHVWKRGDNVIDPSLWIRLGRLFPKLKLSLTSDSTMKHNGFFPRIMNLHAAPITHLTMAIDTFDQYTAIPSAEEILGVSSFYHNTLRVLHINNTTFCKNTENQRIVSHSILRLVRQCKLLTDLTVNCLLGTDVVHDLLKTGHLKSLVYCDKKLGQYVRHSL